MRPGETRPGLTRVHHTVFGPGWSRGEVLAGEVEARFDSGTFSGWIPGRASELFRVLYVPFTERK